MIGHQLNAYSKTKVKKSRHKIMQLHVNLSTYGFYTMLDA